MLLIEVSVADYKGKNQIVKIKAVRGEAHQRLRRAFHYSYEATVDNVKYLGQVVHSYDNGAVALTAKITRAIVSQQRAARKAAAK